LVFFTQWGQRITVNKLKNKITFSDWTIWIEINYPKMSCKISSSSVRLPWGFW
jgi:hypothetical protein